MRPVGYYTYKHVEVPLQILQMKGQDFTLLLYYSLMIHGRLGGYME